MSVTGTDIGHGVTIEVRSIDGAPVGMAYNHPGQGGTCAGWVPFGAPDGWTVESLDPLTLSPSLLCRGCGHHGFVRGGRWVPA